MKVSQQHATRSAPSTHSAQAAQPCRSTKRHDAAYRRDGLWLAALIHRLSGLGLAIFLPVHFLFLGLALEGDAKLQTALQWTANPMVKIAETGLVFLLTVHLLGGVRLLLIENLPWQDNQKTRAALALLLGAAIALIFLVRAL